jgi:uncharacterized membrane protein
VASTEEGLVDRWSGRLAAARVSPTHYDLDRLRGFSDCVFAVAITLVVGTFRLPPSTYDAVEMRTFLADRWPNYLAYLAGFLVIGYYWLSHHRLYELLVRVDGLAVAGNFLLLFFVVLLPFATEVLGQYRGLPDAYRFLDLLAVCLGVVNWAVWWYATAGHRLVASRLHPTALRIYRWRAAWLPIVFAVSYLVTLGAPVAHENISDNWVRLAAATWALLFLGRPLIRVVLGPMPMVEAREEAGEVDDEDTGELRAVSAGSNLTMLERAVRRTAGMGRLISFSDNVYAFAITLLGTHFIVPSQTDIDTKGLDAALRSHVVPDGLAYALGFYVIASFWVLHHRMFNVIERQDGVLRVLNLGHLMLLAIIPFSTDLLSTFADDQLPFVVYALSAGLVSLSLAVMFQYASGPAGLLVDGFAEQQIRVRRRARWANVVCFAASVGLALVNIGSFQGWSVAWVLWLVPLATYYFLTRPRRGPSFVSASHPV